jgi:hypothetical protein
MLPEEIPTIGAYNIKKAIVCAGICDLARKYAKGGKYAGVKRLKEWRPAYFYIER